MLVFLRSKKFDNFKLGVVGRLAIQVRFINNQQLSYMNIVTVSVMVSQALRSFEIRYPVI